jgi:hypothetical protein
MDNASQFLSELNFLGVKRIRWTVNENEAPIKQGVLQIDWSESEFYIPLDTGGPDDFATGLVNNGIISTYMLTFWDKASYPDGWEPPYEGYTRFKTDEEIERYLEYVRFVVRYFKGRIQYYELWNEPEQGAPIQQIEVAYPTGGPGGEDSSWRCSLTGAGVA